MTIKQFNYTKNSNTATKIFKRKAINTLYLQN